MPQPQRKPHLLVVDDDVLLLRSLCRGTRNSLRSKCATSVEEAPQRVDGGPLSDVFLCDLLSFEWIPFARAAAPLAAPYEPAPSPAPSEPIVEAPVDETPATLADAAER